MRAKLTFNLPEEKTEFLQAVKSGDMAVALFEIQSRLWRKFEDVEEGECEASWYTFLQEINRCLENRGIDVDRLNQ